MRSPIVADDLSEHLDCGAFREKDRRSFKDFMNILDSIEFRKFVKVDKEFKEYPFYPPRLITAHFYLYLQLDGSFNVFVPDYYNSVLYLGRGLLFTERLNCRSQCSPGNLTAEGSLQLSRLGNHLRKVYENTDLFNEENRLDVKVTASPFRLIIYSNILQWNSIADELSNLPSHSFLLFSFQ